MTSRQENKLGMFIGVQAFYEENDALFNPLPHFNTLITDFKNTINSIIKEAGIAGEDNTGYAIEKNEARQELEKITVKVANALETYCLSMGQTALIEADDYLPSALSNATDSDVYVLACQLSLKAVPVKNLLLPYDCTAADVEQIATASEKFLPQISVARNIRKERKRSVKKLAGYYKHADELLEKSDIYMAVYRFTRNPLWLTYKGMRKITDNASGHTVHKKKGQALPGFVAHAPFADEVLKKATKLLLSNMGKTGELIFYFSNKPNIRPQQDTKLNKVQNNKTLKTTLSDAGYSVHTPFLNIFNPNVRHGQWKAEVGKEVGSKQ